MQKGDLYVTFVNVSGSVTQQNPLFDWRLRAHTKAANEFKVFQPKNDRVRFTFDMSMNTSGPILDGTGEGSVDCNDDISV